MGPNGRYGLTRQHSAREAVVRLPRAANHISQLFKTRRDSDYRKNSLAEDFRDIRNLVFANAPRTLMDIRRSDAPEASAGEVDPKALSDVMGNTISESKALQRTYTPAQIATAAKVPETRRKGRRARAANESGS